MQLGSMLRRSAAFAAPLSVAVLPKCPLCLMPILAALGVAVPSGALLDAFAVTFVGGLTFVLVRAEPAVLPRALTLSGAALLLVGRLTPLTFATWAGAALMVAVAVLRARRASACDECDSCAR